ncbi:MAG: leucine-rich repeat-containing protein kinase family protein [Methylophilus sp.]|nr:leucine-rich repeat-containing protein kinase family protein [Methylophilus sp.]
MQFNPMASADTLALLDAGKLVGAKHIKISAGLNHFPAALYTLVDTLEILDLTGNALSSLPDDFHRFNKLRILFCSSNQFTELPAVLGKCKSLSMIGFKANQLSHIAEHAIPTQNLRWFIVTDNALTQLPDSLGACVKLQKLMLAGNQLSALPETLANCHALELLRISANQLDTLPNWLLDLPKLAWLAYAGNPFSNAIEIKQMRQHQPLAIDWSQLIIGRVLGEGASGVTYQADWLHDGMREAVAVKLFKSGLTSDGLPSSEIDANIIAGEHTNLVGVKGMVTRHPQHVQGLVMPLLNAELTILAQPPSFESCTRDVYIDEPKLTVEQATHIATAVFCAMQHLHAKGLMHGDLYAHNTLWNDEQVILSDLGGASFLPLDDVLVTAKLKAIELRAFNILLDELARQCGATAETLSQSLNLGRSTP